MLARPRISRYPTAATKCNVLPMVWPVTNEPVDCRPSRGTNKHTQDRKRCSLLDDNSTATADYDSAHANYTVNYIRQLQNYDYIHMTTTTSYKSILLHVTLVFRIQGGAYFQTNLKWLAHKIWMLKSNFNLAVRKFVRFFIAVQNFKKFGQV